MRFVEKIADSDAEINAEKNNIAPKNNNRGMAAKPSEKIKKSKSGKSSWYGSAVSSKGP